MNNKITYFKLNANNQEELIKLIELYETVFEMDPFEYPRINYQKKLLNTDNIIFVVAKYEKKIIGV